MKKTWLVAAAVVVVAALSGLSMYTLNSDETTIVYDLEAIVRGDIESVVIATGALEPVNTVIVGSEISGQISELLVDFNDSVEDGQILARIDPRTHEARRQQREADLQVAQATIVSRRAELNRAQSVQKRTQAEYERRRALANSGHVSATELDQDLNNLDNANATVEIAAASLVNAEAGLVRAQADLDQTLLDLDRTYIRSPISGTVINRAVEIGQTVAASFSAPELFSIAHDLHRMKVEASIDEADIGRLNEGMKCRFSVDAYVEREFNGEISQIRKAPQVQSNVVTYKVIVTANNADLALLPGMTANVTIVLGKREGVLKLANAALRFIPKNQQDLSPTATLGSRTPSPPSGGAGRRTPELQLDEWRERLGLSDQQIERIREIYARLGERMRAMRSTGGPPSDGRRGGTDRRAQLQAIMTSVNRDIEGVLDLEQRSKFRLLMAGRMERKPATIYVLNEGKVAPKSIVIGLQDDTSTEVVSGLEEGDEIIVRAKRAAT